jgi:hypothetical protein
MRIPRPALLSLSAALTAAAYYLILFTNLGNAYYGGSYRGQVLTDVLAVLATFACLEVVRSERVLAVRALAGALAVPLILVMLLLFWYGIQRYLAG